MVDVEPLNCRPAKLSSLPYRTAEFEQAEWGKSKTTVHAWAWNFHDIPWTSEIKFRHFLQPRHVLLWIPWWQEKWSKYLAFAAPYPSGDALENSNNQGPEQPSKFQNHNISKSNLRNTVSTGMFHSLQLIALLFLEQMLDIVSSPERNIHLWFVHWAQHAVHLHSDRLRLGLGIWSWIHCQMRRLLGIEDKKKTTDGVSPMAFSQRNIPSTNTFFFMCNVTSVWTRS